MFVVTTSNSYLASNLHGRSTVIFLFQKFSHSPEVSQLKPTSFQTAGPGDSVTLAGDMGLVVDGLVNDRHS